MTTTPAALYLDLLKKTLSFTLWPEPPIPITQYNHQRPALKRLGVSILSRLFAPFDLQLVRPAPFADSDRYDGRIWPGYADTMIGRQRLDNLQYCVESALRDGIAGDLIEAGVWRGGACIFMRAVLAAHGVTDRKVFVADSFAGLPPPDTASHPADAGDEHHRYATLAVSRDEVAANFQRYGLLDEQVVFLEGWFSDTLPTAPIDRLAVLRLDGDMYGSTMDALTSLYPKLSSGGFCIIDDYALPGCRQAVTDFRTANNIDAELHDIDWTGCYWRKP